MRPRVAIRRHLVPGLAMLAGFVVSACAHQVHYEPPVVAVDGDRFKENPDWKPAEPGDAAARGPWWTLFADPQLDTLENKVDISNQTLKAASARFSEARAVVRQTRANLSPQITAVPSAGVVQPSGARATTAFHDPYADFVLPIDVSYEVDVWGRVRGTVTASVATAQASAADLESVRLSLHAELASDYFALRAIDRDKALLDAAVSAYERAAELTRTRFTGGLSSGADVAQAETQLESTRAQAIEVQVQRAAVEHAIAVLIGEPATSFTLSSVDSGFGTLPTIPATVPSALLERRPDIAAAERRLLAASANVGVASAALYPIVSLSGGAGFESSTIGQLLTGTAGFWSVGVAAAATLADGGRRRAVVAERQAEYEEHAADYQATVLTAFREVEDQLAALRILDDESEVQARAVAAAERSLALATTRYRGGVVSYLEVVIAQNAELAAERVAVGIAERRIAATILLLKAIGGDWNRTLLPTTDVVQAR